MKTCTNCEGRKKVRGIGMMNQDCHVCKGKGYVIEPEKFAEPEVKKSKGTKHGKEVSA